MGSSACKEPIRKYPSNPLVERYMVSTSTSDECIICFEDLWGKDVARLHCGHTFCEECIEEWFETSQTCPVCRLDVYVVEKFEKCKPKKNRRQPRNEDVD